MIKYWSNLDFTNVPITALMKRAAGQGDPAGERRQRRRPWGGSTPRALAKAQPVHGGRHPGYRRGGAAQSSTGSSTPASITRAWDPATSSSSTAGGCAPADAGGCFEAYCSATALIKRTRQAMEEDRTSKLWELAGSLGGVNGRTPSTPPPRAIQRGQGHRRVCGLPGARGGQPGQHLPAGGHLHRRRPLRPGETLMAPVRFILNREDYARNNLHRTRLVRAALGNDAGLIGAAARRCSGRAPGLNSAPAPQRQRRTSLTAGPPFFRTRRRGPLPGPLALPRPPPAGKRSRRARTEWPP